MTPCLPLALIPDSFLAPVAIGFTVATACFALYWVVAAFGLFDHDAYDGNAESAAGMSLHFFFGHAPPVLVLSLASIVGFVVSVVAAPQVAAWPAWQQLLLDLPIAGVALVTSRFLSMPIGRMFRRIRSEEIQEQNWTPVGMLARVVSLDVSEAGGQIEVNKGGPSVLLSARARPGATFKKGEVVQVISRDGGSGYLVGPPA